MFNGSLATGLQAPSVAEAKMSRVRSMAGDIDPSALMGTP
jgi:hypothetical protein